MLGGLGSLVAGQGLKSSLSGEGSVWPREDSPQQTARRELDPFLVPALGKSPSSGRGGVGPIGQAP